MPTPNAPVFVPVVVQAPAGENSHDLIPQITSLVGSIASLLWVTLAIVIVVLFRDEFRNLLRKLKKGKLFGQEIEFEEELQKLSTKAEKVQEEAAKVASSQPTELDTEKAATDEKKIDEIIRSAAEAPKTNLIMLGREIEREMQRVLRVIGRSNEQRFVSLGQGMSELKKLGWVGDLASSVELFQKIRNAIVHGQANPSESDIISAIDSGAKILSALNTLPRMRHMIVETGIPLFLEPSGASRSIDITGIKVSGIGRDDFTNFTEIYPTNKDYKVGAYVTWEWDKSRPVLPHYWFEPNAKQYLLAWKRRMPLFVGRDINEI